MRAAHPGAGRGAGEEVSDLTGPIRQRRDRGVRHQRRRLLVLLVAGVLALAATWAVAFSPLLATREVRVEGSVLLAPDLVADTAQVPLDLPLLRQDTRAIAARTTALAPVREVDVVRSWPHTLLVRVTERTPTVAFGIDGGYLLVDSDGVAYATVPDLPEGVLLAEGDATFDPTTQAVGRTVGTLPTEVRDRVTGVRADSPADVVLELDEEYAVAWGGPDQPDLKGRVLAVLLDQVPDAELYDVSAPAFPTTR